MQLIRKYKHLLGYVCVAVAMAFLFAQVHSQQNQISANVHRQLANRVKNVGAWCHGIDTTRGYMRLVLAKYNVQIKIPDLNCKALEQATLKSAK